jgi:hypothetical protein
MGALPTAEVFRAMTAKGFSPPQILNAINRKLHTLLPTGMFLAAAFVRLPENLEYLEVCNCGLPDGLLLSSGRHAIKHKFVSQSLPLGILPQQDLEQAFETLEISEGDRLLMSSDGVVEAQGKDAALFGWHRLEQAILASAGRANVLDAVNEALDAFCAGEPQADDISLLDLPCEQALFHSCVNGPEYVGPKHQAIVGQAYVDEPADCEWEANIVLNGPRLASVDPVPLLLNHLRELEGEAVDFRPLFTVITELFVNALDHGVMKMDSGLKSDEEGFGRYFQERERRLALLRKDKDQVKLSLHCQATKNDRLLCIRVEDSGSGFNHEHIQEEISNNTDPLRLYGRGIQLLKTLCVSLDYRASGNVAEAVYRLNSTE